MLTVCTTSTDTTYISTGDVLRAAFGATSTDGVTSAELDYLITLAARASAWADAYLGYPLGVQTYQETLPGLGGRYLVLGRTPIRAVLRLFDATDTGNATELDSSDYRLEDREAGFLSRDRGFSWTAIERRTGGDFNFGLTGYIQPGMETRPWLVEYVAGYVPAGGIDTGSGNWTTAAAEGTSTGTTLPADIRQAVALRAAELFANPQGVVSRRVGDLMVEYQSAGPGIGGRLSEAERMLLPYRRLA